MSEGDARSGAIGGDLGPEDARALLRAWLDAVELDLTTRPARAPAVRRLLARRPAAARAPRATSASSQAAVGAGRGEPVGEIAGWAPRDGALRRRASPPIPYAPAAAFLGREKRKLAARDDEPVRVALVADGLDGMHGVTHTLDEIRERGVPGFEVEVIGTDADVDRRLSAVAEVDDPVLRRA